MQDLGDKLRLVVTAHRRVKIIGQLIEELEEVAEKREFDPCFMLNSLHNKKFPLNAATTIKFPFSNTQISISPDESDADKRRRKHRLARPVVSIKKPDAKDKTETSAKIDGEPTEAKEVKKPKIVTGDAGIQPLLMVEVENIQHDDFKQTQEVKALTQEVIKTIRDIITMNPLYR